MAIITIYQGASGSGEELANAVSESVGYGCIDREVLLEASLRYDIPEAKLNDIVERDPSWWQRLDMKPYRLAFQAAFCDLIAASGGDGIVYHGHLGHGLIPHLKHVLRVLLTAPMEMRVEQVRLRQHLSEAAARRYVEEVDKARTRRLIALFDADWRDSSRYDLVLNLGRMSVEAARRMIVQASRLDDYQITPASKQAFEDFALATRVRALLALDDEMPKSRLEVKASGGRVAVSGLVPIWVSQDSLVKRIEKTPGVTP